MANFWSASRPTGCRWRRGIFCFEGSLGRTNTALCKMEIDMAAYTPISPLPKDFSDPNASAADALATVWRDRLQDLQSSVALHKFNEQLYRRWAIETGILERLYSLDRGVRY